MTLKENWCEYKPSINHLHVLVVLHFAHVSKEAKTKLESKSVKCIFISYCEENKGYKLYNLRSQYVIISCDVIFDESNNFNKELMVSRLDFGSKHMVINQEIEMEDERILQQV
jgi:hypothetical protein